MLTKLSLKKKIQTDTLLNVEVKNRHLKSFIEKNYEKSKQSKMMISGLSLLFISIYNIAIFKYINLEDPTIFYSTIAFQVIFLSWLALNQIDLYHKLTLLKKLITSFDKNITKSNALKEHIEELKENLALLSSEQSKDSNLKKSTAYQVMQEALKAKKELEKQEKQLKKSNEKLLKSLELTNIGIWSWNIDENVICWDDTTHRIFGLKPNTFIGQYEHFLALVHYSDRKLTHQVIQSCIDNNKNVDIRIQIAQCNGNNRFVRFRAQVAQIESEHAEKVQRHLVGTIIDITDDIKEFELSKKFFSLSPNLFMVVSDANTIINIDAYSAMRLGYQPEDLISRNILDFLHPRDRKSSQSEIKKAQTHAYKNVIMKNRFKTKKGVYKDLAWTLKAEDDSGQVYCFAKSPEPDLAEIKEEDKKKKPEINWTI